MTPRPLLIARARCQPLPKRQPLSPDAFAPPKPTRDLPRAAPPDQTLPVARVKPPSSNSAQGGGGSPHPRRVVLQDGAPLISQHSHFPGGGPAPEDVPLPFPVDPPGPEERPVGGPFPDPRRV